MNLSWLLASFIAFGLSIILTPIIRQWSLTNRIGLAIPRSRDVHQRELPRLGGVAISLSFIVVTILTWLIKPEWLHFVDKKVVGIDQNLLGVIVGVVILAIMGIVDDIRDLSPWQKLIGQFAAAACIPLFGVHIQWLAHPFGGNIIELTHTMDAVISILWIVLIINVVNFLDGLDGLAIGTTSVALTVLILLSLATYVNQPALAVLLLIFLGACLGFLPYNWHPSSIILGDSGSLVLGFILGTAAIISGGKVATAGLVLGLPILDALWAIIRRLATGKSPFAADRHHLHHRLLDLGLPQPVVVTILLLISIVFGAIALSSRTAGKVEALFIMVILMIMILITLSLIERFYHKEK